MKTMKRMFQTIPMMVLSLFASVSCTSDDMLEGIVEQPVEEARVPRRAVMNLQGGVVPFDAATRAEAEEWKDSSKVYLQFTVGTSTVDGVAIWNDSTAQWTVEYYGTLSEGGEAKCEAYYFENAGKSTFSSVVLTEHTAIYADKSAVYMFEDNTLTVMANLTPMTGRIRLKGDSGQSYRFSGVKHYDSYNISTNSFTTKERIHISTVGEDGYSPYYYAFFPDEEDKEICFDDMASGISLVKTLGEKALAVGRSGYLDIPTMNKRSGWKILTKDVTVNDVTFRMIRVLYSLDSNYSSDADPYFYIGETEVTQVLWDSIMGVGYNPSDYMGDDLPVYDLSYYYIETFISNLQTKTGLPFRLPTSAEWVYAAKGGCASKGYAYSGSDNADDVAWHSENSDGTVHPVKGKLPNEIGIYDMSGNVCEFINYYYYRYTDYYNYGGGCYSSSPDVSVIQCTVSSSTSSLTEMGLRIAIDNLE